MQKTVFVIDAYNLIYRMFYAIPEMRTNSGEVVNAIFWVAKFLKQIFEENPHANFIVATDTGKSFRSESFSEYKGTREKMPDNLKTQIEWVFGLFEAANIPVIGIPGYEADDIMGSIAVQYASDEHQVVIISSDKDLCQFVKDWKVHIYDAMKRKFMKESDVFEKFWVPASQVRDYLSIVGDSSDNIPGIPWFWPKKAVDLLARYQTLENIYAHAHELTPKLADWLLNARESAFLSQHLATIVTDLHLELNTSLEWANIYTPEYIQYLRSYDFRSLIPETAKIHIDKPTIEEVELTTESQLQSLLQTANARNMSIAVTESDETLYCCLEGKVYILKNNTLPLKLFIDAIMAGDIEVSLYDAKKEFSRIIDMATLKDSTNQISLL